MYHLNLGLLLVLLLVRPFLSVATPEFPYIESPARDVSSLENGINLRILPLGDSITWGYGSTDGNGYRLDLLNLLAGNDVQYIGSQRSGNMTDNYNEGHPGATVYQIAVFANLSLYEMPNIVLLMAGTNDMYTDANATAAPGQLGSLIDQIFEQCPLSTVLVAEIIPIGALFNGSEARVEVYNAAIPGIVDSRVSAGKHVIAVNMSSYVALNDMADALHPDNMGYSLMAQGWYAGLRQAASNGWIENVLDTNASGNTTNGTSKKNGADSFKRNSFWAMFATLSVGLSAVALI